MREGVSSVTWRTNTFAFVEGFAEAKNRYRGLRSGQVLAFSFDAIGLLVKSETAEAQLEAEGPKSPLTEFPASVQAFKVRRPKLSTPPPFAAEFPASVQAFSVRVSAL